MVFTAGMLIYLSYVDICVSYWFTVPVHSQDNVS